MTRMFKRMREQWVTIFFGAYEISNLGRVRRVKPGPGTRPGKLLKPYAPPNRDDYTRVRLHYRGAIRQTTVAKLVQNYFR